MGSLGQHRHKLVFQNASDSICLCVDVGEGGMRVGPQYQAVVPEFDPGKNVRKHGL